MNRKTRKPDMRQGKPGDKQFIKLLRAYVVQHWTVAQRRELPDVIVGIIEHCDLDKRMPFHNQSIQFVIEGKPARAAASR